MSLARRTPRKEPAKPATTVYASIPHILVGGQRGGHAERVAEEIRAAHASGHDVVVVSPRAAGLGGRHEIRMQLRDLGLPAAVVDSLGWSTVDPTVKPAEPAAPVAPPVPVLPADAPETAPAVTADEPMAWPEDRSRRRR